MNIDDKLKAWLEAKPEERDPEEGNLLLLKLSGNKVAYNMIKANYKKFASHVERQLQKYYNFRVRKITHLQVKEMESKVKKIVEENISLSVKAADFKKGLRPDHDSLPEEIRSLVDKNTEILVKMRNLHIKLRGLSLTDAPCPDSERYPFLKELISLDKKLHANWKKYDEYNQ